MHLALLGCLLLSPQPQWVGDGFTPTGMLLRPAGKTIPFGGRPVDVVIPKGGTQALVKDMGGLRVVDLAAGTESLVAASGGASTFGLTETAQGTILFTNAASGMHEFAPSNGKWTLKRTINLPGLAGKGASYPVGVATQGDKAYVCLSRNNQLAEVDLDSGKVLRTFEVGVAPYGVALVPDAGLALVSNQGGRRPAPGDTTAPSAGTETVVDERGIASTGMVTVVNLRSGQTFGSIRVGLQPNAVTLLEAPYAAVANANSDSVSIVDYLERREVVRHQVKPNEGVPFGSMPNALAYDAGTKRLYVANAGNNALAVLDVANPRTPRTLGFLPTGWYPAAVALTPSSVVVVNNKGMGSRTRVRPEVEGWNSHDHRGSVQVVTRPDASALRSGTAAVNELAMIPQILRTMERRGSSKAKPKPIPTRLGDPSTIEHVIYVIKENRTYDQIFGDMPQGRGDKRLCLYPEAITPNHHALAREFVLLDNYYCNGVLSADGHSWATEGNVTPYLERAFGGFTRSYTFGDDPITYSSSGFIWDHILAAGFSFRNYGEMDYAEPPTPMGFKPIWDKYKAGERIEFTQNVGIARLRSYTARSYPGWNMNIPDVLRMDRFLEEFKEYEKKGVFPNFTLVYLPQDHASGTSPGYPTPRAHMADNDLAVGRLVEAVSKSKFWPKTAIFINEDDPQAGFDHVDGHRSICLVVSPYTKRGAVVSDFYNQTSVLATMERIFGLRPMNQRTASSPIMFACFTDKPNPKPYTARPVTVPLDELNPDKSELAGWPLHWAEVSETIPIKRTGMKTSKDEDNLNRILWHAAKGWTAPYPADLAGPHGKGLKSLRLVHGGDDD